MTEGFKNVGCLRTINNENIYKLMSYCFDGFPTSIAYTFYIINGTTAKVITKLLSAIPNRNNTSEQ